MSVLKLSWPRIYRLSPRLMEKTQSKAKRFALTILYLSIAGGHYYYEIHPGSDANASKTCFDKCTEQYGCGGCGRPNCQGNLCDSCLEYCWDMPSPVNGFQHFWKDGLWGYWTKCFDNYQLFEFSENNVPDTPDYPMDLLINVNRNNSRLVAYFDSISVENGLLTVGNYVSGDAGNFWQAPFENRSLVNYENSTCLPFFYPSMNTCIANGLPHPNNTFITGYAWYTGNAIMDADVVHEITLWMKRKGF
ncbi:hypothetical protein SK128_027297 [Halocaridina rubra]|uniref:Uncharacterized protein n=1 Tax=Halocaridina rubra TaxID=373956 RepID=A0AAN8WF65_HALRR